MCMSSLYRKCVPSATCRRTLATFVVVALAAVVGLGLSGCGSKSASAEPYKYAVAQGKDATPLDEYVAKPDPAYKYEKVAEAENDKCRTVAYHMVSQTWLDKTMVDRPLWEHAVLVSIPKERRFTNKAMLFIGGGGNGTSDKKPEPKNDTMELIAHLTKSVVIEIKHIPNQPLFFVGDEAEKYKKDGRKEDALIGFGWDKFLNGGDPIWLARLPMTKAVVRAMDLVQTEYPEIEGFFVAGGSKRGWTTWTVAAVDKRVFGIAPAVIDVLNVAKSLQNHHDAYGFWAPAVGNYVETNCVQRIHTPEFANLMKVVDPYSYRDRLTMPKYILNGGGDQFFPPDSWKFYFDDLKGPKYLRYVPNCDHGLNSQAYYELATFYQCIMAGNSLPKFTWEKAADGTLTVKCETKPSKVLQWQAYNLAARDFRLESIGKKYVSSVLEESAPGVYKSDVKAGDAGWKAFLIELEFPNPDPDFGLPFKFTTGVSIVPDTYPGKDKPL